MKTYFRFVVLISIFMFFIPNNGNAQSCHGGGEDHSSHNSTPTVMSNPPHGGIVKQAGKYYIEMVKNPLSSTEKVIFYVLRNRKNGEVVSNKIITGTLSIIDQKGEIVKGNLTKINNDGFVMSQSDIKPVNLIVSFKIKKKTIKSTFQYGSDFYQQLLYSCSMHTEITSDKSGKCRKCGMNLALIE